jgi:deazaflavin-dependent oxidoreductase (nitroreductase family)
MARPFQYSLDRRIVNRNLTWLLKLGIAPSIYYLLTVIGRKTGNPHSLPLVLVEEKKKRWLVAPYGEVDWVKNARASGVVNLTKRKRSEDYTFRELSPEDAAPILKKYLELFSLTKPYFNARLDSSLDEFVADARSRPVFELFKIEAEKD